MGYNGILSISLVNDSCLNVCRAAYFNNAYYIYIYILYIYTYIYYIHIYIYIYIYIYNIYIYISYDQTSSNKNIASPSCFFSISIGIYIICISIYIYYPSQAMPIPSSNVAGNPCFSRLAIAVLVELRMQCPQLVLAFGAEPSWRETKNMKNHGKMVS